MNLTVKLVGPLSRFLPAGSSGNETQVNAADGATVSDLIKMLGLPDDLKFIVSINDDIVPIQERQSRSLSSSDSIKIIPPLKGG